MHPLHQAGKTVPSRVDGLLRSGTRRNRRRCSTCRPEKTSAAISSCGLSASGVPRWTWRWNRAGYCGGRPATDRADQLRPDDPGTQRRESGSAAPSVATRDRSSILRIGHRTRTHSDVLPQRPAAMSRDGHQTVDFPESLALAGSGTCLARCVTCLVLGAARSPVAREARSEAS